MACEHIPYGVGVRAPRPARRTWHRLDAAENTLAANAHMLESFGSEDFREGVAHFVEKRARRFTGR